MFYRFYKVTAVSPITQLMITATLNNSKSTPYSWMIPWLYRLCCFMTSWNCVILLAHLQRYINWVSTGNLNGRWQLILYYYTGMFYYQLLNLPPQYRSTLRSIHLVAIAKHTVIRKYDSDEILKPFIDDLKKLEQVDNCRWFAV